MDELTDVLRRLRERAFARVAVVLDEDGELVAGDAEGVAPSAALREMWITQLGGAQGLARQMPMSDFAVLFHDVSGEDVHISTLTEERVLCVAFSQAHTSLGTVRLALKALRGDLMKAIGHDGDDAA